MDKEAREQIKAGVIGATDTNMTVDEAVEYIVGELEELGYRKLPEGQPPLLNDDEIEKAWDSVNPIPELGFIMRAEAIAQAQREADIKHYETDTDTQGK